MLQIFRGYFFFKIRDKRIFEYFHFFLFFFLGGGGWGGGDWVAVEVIFEDFNSETE